MQHIGLVGVIVLAVVTGVTVGASSIAAGQQSEPTLSGVLDGPAEDQSPVDWALNGASSTWALLDGAQQRAGWWVRQKVPGTETEATAAEKANAVQDRWNAENATLEAYANERSNWTENHTVRITWYVDGETATRYLLANASNDSIETTMVDSTSRDADEHVDLCGYAAVESPDELQAFVDDYAAPGEDVDTAYLAGLKGKYGDDVDASLYPTSGECSAQVNATQEVSAGAW